MFYVYVLKSRKNGEIYVGSTSDLQRRFKEHNQGAEISTKRYAPWRLVAYEAYVDETDARDREHKLKHHGNAMKMLKKRIANSLEDRSESSAGFTLIELLIIIGLIAVVTAMSVLLGFDAILRGTVHSERDLIVSSLTTARAQALANVDEVAHGLEITGTEIIYFDANSSCTKISGTERTIERSDNIAVTDDAGDVIVIFEQLSGRVCEGTGNMTISDGAQASVISINSEGRIDW